MAKNKDLIVIIAILACASMIIWMIWPIMTQFVFSMIFCYILNPVANKVSSFFKINRNYSSIIIVSLFFALLFVICFSVFPMFYKQLVEIGSHIPSYNSIMNNHYISRIVGFISGIFPDLATSLKSGIQEMTGQFFTASGWLTKGLIKSSMTLFNTISSILIAPFITFFILRDLKKLKNFVCISVPQRYRNDLYELSRDINEVLFSYLCGQFYVACALSIYYTIGFYFLCVDSKIALGVMSGFSVFVPYLGPVVSFVVSMITVTLQIGTMKSFGILIVIFIVGQLLEGMFLTPKLIGDKTGLHPVFIIFFLLLGGSMFGLTGMLLAVPAAAVLMVVAKYLLRKYYSSAFYNLR